MGAVSRVHVHVLARKAKRAMITATRRSRGYLRAAILANKRVIYMCELTCHKTSVRELTDLARGAFGRHKISAKARFQGGICHFFVFCESSGEDVRLNAAHVFIECSDHCRERDQFLAPGDL